jgi:hypothetical protein
MDRHFPNWFPCKGACGTPGCRHIAATQKDLIYHNSSKDPQRECPQCGNKYSTKFVLQTHIQNVHNKHKQVIEYAAGAGYDIGYLATKAPWVTGQATDGECSMENETDRAMEITSDAKWEATKLEDIR